MQRIEQTYFIAAPPERVWAALTEPGLMARWSGQPAEYDARLGGRYRLWTDYVSGEVVEYEPPRRLAQTWLPSDWTIGNSVVSFTLRPIAGGTELVLVHENVQPEDYEGTQEGWNQFYIGALKNMVEAEAKKKPRARRAPAKNRQKRQGKAGTGAKPARRAPARKTPAATRKRAPTSTRKRK